jgi:hypothetical protein
LSKFVTQNFNHGTHEAAAVAITVAFAIAAAVVDLVSAIVTTAATAAATYFAASHPRTSGQHGQSLTKASIRRRQQRQ